MSDSAKLYKQIEDIFKEKCECIVYGSYNNTNTYAIGRIHYFKVITLEDNQFIINASVVLSCTTEIRDIKHIYKITRG